MNTTFTTCAEKKAKQFLNLLQGYTKSIRMTAILILLLMGVSNAWAYNFKNPHIYFNNTSLKLNPAMLLVGHNNYSIGYNQTSNPIDNTNLVYFHPSADWGDQDGFTIGQGSNWGGDSNQSFTKRAAYLTNHIGLKYSYNFDYEKTYYVTGTAGNNPTISVEYKSAGYSGIPKYNATQAAKLRNDISSSYTTVDGTWPTTLKLKGTYLSGNGSSARSEISGTASGNAESNRVYGAVVTGKITHTYNTITGNYIFEGWGTGTTPSTTNASYEYNITAHTTVYAFFTKAYTVTYGKKGESGSSTVSATVTANSTTKSINSGTKVAAGSTINLTANPASGYRVVGWYSDANCTNQLQNGGNTYNAGTLTAAKTVYVKFEETKYDVTIQAGANGSVYPNGEQAVGSSNGLEVTANPNLGYKFTEWAVTGGAIVSSTTTNPTTLTATSSGTLTANFTANQYTITYNTNGGSGTMTPTSYTIETATFDLPTPTKTGYTFEGWYTASDFSGSKVTQIAQGSTGNKTFYAQWTANTYTVTLDQTGAAKEGSTTSVDANFEGNMPAITGDGALPTPQIGYTFMGYFDQKDGKGTQYYNQEGTAFDNKKWDKTKNDTLYAYFQPAKITNITLDKEVFEPISSGEAYVTATPTIDPSDIEGVVVCWRLLYSNGDEVAEHPAIPAGDNNKVKFSIVGLATGTYTIEATLHATACGDGEPLSTLTKNFIIASEYTVTVKYTCDNQEIKASTTAPAHATEPATLIAPEIFGYAFSAWEAGDGVVISSTNDNSVTFTAYYDGNLTATYTRNEDIIYFYNTLGWQNVYVYFYSGFKIDGNEVGYWNDEKGTGSQPKTNDNDWYGGSYKGYAQMEQIAGTDIWYVNASGKSTTYLAFCKDLQDKYDFFFATEVVRRNDYNKTLPMYVPIKAAPEYKNQKNSDKTTYYNKGYWMNYPENTGYKLQIYDGTGNGAKEVASVRFPYSTNTIMPLTVSVDLEAGKTYGFKILREDNTYFSNSGIMTAANSNGWSFTYGIDQNCGLQTTIAGDYTFTLKYTTPDKNNLNKYEYCVDVVYPVSVGDYRVIYKDDAKWSQTAAHGANWYHPSYAIKQKSSATEEKTDIVSFFIAKDNTPTMKFQKCTDISGQTVTWADVTNGTITIPNNVVTAAGVYNFIVKQPAGSESIYVESVEPYTGNYYIRVDAVDGKWGNYKTDPDNRMTYSAFSESDANSFGEEFSHYKTKWCPRGTNVKFTIANDYSPCITDTLIRDITRTWDENMDDGGKLYTDNSQDPTADKYSANIRFMWDRTTNKISRAYLSSATNVTKKFLILQGDEKMADSDGNAIAATTYVPANATLLQDKENWIYETTIKVKPGARVKLYACYTKTEVEEAQYFRGKKGDFNDEKNTVQILGGTGDTWYTMRVIYDFKTNRLMGAWVPDTEISDNGLQIDADIMIMREHQEEATCINLTENANSKLTDVKTVYGVMRFNRWILNNRANPKDLDVDHCSTFDGKDRNYDEKKVKDHHPVLPLIEQKSIYERSLYFISFPFDVNLSDVFGFGTYWNEWYIEYYDGLKRAREGFFIDSPPNWKYVTPEMADTFKLRAYQGYILGVDLDYMQYNNTSFWAHNIQEIELFFPSTTTMKEIAKAEVTMPALGPEYECKINRPNSDHRVIDSYWRCIGVPSYANYDGLLYTDEDKKQSITWKTDYTWKGDYSEFPFLYSWNTTDNTITPRSTREFKFKAMHSYLVQHKDSIHWSAVNVNVTPSPAAIMAREMEETRREYEWRITLTKGEKEQDQTFIRLTNHEQVTTEFDFNQDLSKEFNYGRSDIYTLIGNTKAAANSLPITETTTLIPLGLSIEFNGDYTIAMPDRMENIGVALIDTESNTRTNLSAGMEYTLTLNKGDYNNRFFIEISPIQQTPTDIEYVENSHDDQARKVLIDNILYIVRDGQMFDARGARLK